MWRENVKPRVKVVEVKSLENSCGKTKERKEKNENTPDIKKFK